MRFSCSSCGQSLVTEESGAGLHIDCPHCATSIQIPRVIWSTEEVERLNDAMAQLRLDLSAMQAAHAESLATNEQQRGELADSAKKNAALQKERDAFFEESDALKIALVESQKEAAALKAAHEELCARNPEVAELVGLRKGNEKLEHDLRRAEIDLADVSEKLERTQRHRSALHERNVELELKLSASRAALSDSQLAQDNEVLRRLVDRINEELKERGPAAKKTNEKTSGFFGAFLTLVRWLWSRSFPAEREI